MRMMHHGNSISSSDSLMCVCHLVLAAILNGCHACVGKLNTAVVWMTSKEQAHMAGFRV